MNSWKLMALLVEIYQYQLTSIDKYYEDSKKELLDAIAEDPVNSQFLIGSSCPKNLKAELIRRFFEDKIKAVISFNPYNGNECISITIPTKSEEFEDTESDKISFVDSIYESQVTSIAKYYDLAKKELFKEIALNPLGSTFHISINCPRTLIPIITKQLVTDGVDVVANPDSFLNYRSMQVTIPNKPKEVIVM